MKSLRHIIERNATLYPNKDAIIFEGRHIGFLEHMQRGLRLADSFFRAGLRRGDRVAILAMNCVEFLELYTACELAGFLPATVNFRLAAPEVQYVLTDSAPRVLVFEAQYASLVDSLRDRFPGIKMICIGTAPTWGRDYESFLEEGSIDGPPIRATEEDYAHLIYTSGTTGSPKGVVRRQRAAYAYGQVAATYKNFGFETRALVATPLFHIGAKCIQIAAHLYGASVILQRAVDPLAIVKAIENERVTYINCVPTMVQMLVDIPGIEKMDLSSLRTVNTAAAPISIPLLKRAIEVFGPVWIQSYGMTEGMAACIYRSELKPDGTPEERKRIGSVGHAMPMVELRVLDEDGADCAAGVPGEIVLRSEALFDHYWNNSVATMEAMRDGWYRTGDIGQFDTDGYLYIVDRKKDIIISGGENIYSREVEIALEQHPDVGEAAVIGVPDDYWGESVAALVIPKLGKAPDEHALIEHCHTLIARYKCPKQIKLVEDLPRLASGKIDKKELRRNHLAAAT